MLSGWVEKGCVWVLFGFRKWVSEVRIMVRGGRLYLLGCGDVGRKGRDIKLEVFIGRGWFLFGRG